MSVRRRVQEVDDMPTYQAIQVDSEGGPLQLAEKDCEPPGPGQVRIDVAACGVCGTDRAIVNGMYPGVSFPLTPGHEIAGTIAEIGDGVDNFSVGDRVGVGWFGGCCFKCIPCRKGFFINCEKGQVPSVSYPGGYAGSVTVPSNALARIPDGLSFVDAAPMGCAGVTTYNALRHTNALPGDRVGVLGIGGLGHLGVQFARAMGFETVAIARGEDKAADAIDLGAHHYVDSTAGDVASALQALGGVTAIVATAANSDAIGQTLGGLVPRGQLVVIGVTADPLPISPAQLIGPSLSVVGHPSGSSRDVEETMQFAVLSGVRARIEEYPLSAAADAYASMERGAARYRGVLTTAE
jgi:alcohol dehydrogenase